MKFGTFFRENIRLSFASIVSNRLRSVLTMAIIAIGIMSLVTLVQIVLIYHGGTLFRTCGLSSGELLVTLALSALVVPADLLRKMWLRLHGRDGAM